MVPAKDVRGTAIDASPIRGTKRTHSKLDKKYTFDPASRGLDLGSSLLRVLHTLVDHHAMTTTIKVTRGTADLLKEKKAALGLKTMDDVVLHLLRESKMDEDEDRAVGRRQKRARAEDEEEKPVRVQQLFAYFLLVEEEKAVKHFTGMSQKCVDWVMAEMEKAVSISCVFCFFGVVLCTRMFGPRFLRY